MPERNRNKNLKWVLLSLLLNFPKLERTKKDDVVLIGNLTLVLQRKGYSMKQLVIWAALVFVIYYGNPVDAQSGK